MSKPEIKHPLYQTYPRIMGNPRNRRIVRNSEEKNAYIQDYVKTHPIYISVYPFKKIIADNLMLMHKHAHVEWMVLDFDPEDCEPFEESMRMHKMLMEKDQMHQWELSGRVVIFISILNRI